MNFESRSKPEPVWSRNHFFEHGISGRTFPALKYLMPSKLYTLSVGKLMHSHHNKLLQNNFDEYFIPVSSIHSHSTRLATSNNLFLPRVNSFSGKCSLTFVGPKVWSSMPNHISFICFRADTMSIV